MNTGKCPHCQNVIFNVKVEDMEMKVGFDSMWRGFSYQCPSCRCILGVQMNPLTLNDDLIADIKKLLR